MGETVKGLNVSLGLDATEFDKGLKNVSNSLKQQGKELKEINGLLKYDKNNVDLWDRKQKNLNQTLQLTQQRISLNNQKLEELRKAANGIDDAQIKSLENAIAKDTKEAEKLELQLKQVQNQLTKLSTISAADLNRFGSNMTRYVTTPIIGAATALTALTISNANSLDALGDNAEKVGLNAEQYQKWNYAAEIMAVNTSTLQRGLVKVNGVLGDIAAGTTTTAVSSALDRIGISIEDLAGLNASDALLQIADGLSKVSDSATKVSVLNDLTGEKIGSELLPLLSLGSEGIGDLFEQLEKLGYATNEQAYQAGLLTDEFTRVKSAMNDVGYELLESLLPLANDVTAFLKEDLTPALKGIIEYIDSLPDFVKEGALGFLVFSAALGPVLQISSQAVITFGNLQKILPKLKLQLDNLNRSAITTGLGIAALVGAMGLVVDTAFKWNELNGIQVFLRGLAAAALTAAAAMAVFHASWSVGLAVGGIIAGIGAVVGIIKEIQNSYGIEGDATSGATQVSQIATNAATQASSTTTNNSSVDNSTNYYNIQISADDYSSAEEVAEQLALKLQSRR